MKPDMNLKGSTVTVIVKICLLSLLVSVILILIVDGCIATVLRPDCNELELFEMPSVSEFGRFIDSKDFDMLQRVSDQKRIMYICISNEDNDRDIYSIGLVDAGKLKDFDDLDNKCDSIPDELAEYIFKNPIKFETILNNYIDRTCDLAHSEQFPELQKRMEKNIVDNCHIYSDALGLSSEETWSEVVASELKVLQVRKKDIKGEGKTEVIGTALDATMEIVVVDLDGDGDKEIILRVWDEQAVMLSSSLEEEWSEALESGFASIILVTDVSGCGNDLLILIEKDQEQFFSPETFKKDEKLQKEEKLGMGNNLFERIIHSRTIHGDTRMPPDISWTNYLSLISIFGLVSAVNNSKRERKSPEEIVKAIFRHASTSPKSINKIAEDSELQWHTVEKYIRLIELIQSLPLKVIKTEGGPTYISRFLAEELTFDQQIVIYKILYSPKLTESEKFLISLLSKPEGEMCEETPEIEHLIKIGRIKKEDNKYSLTRDGEIIARGLEKMFSEERYSL